MLPRQPDSRQVRVDRRGPGDSRRHAGRVPFHRRRPHKGTGDPGVRPRPGDRRTGAGRLSVPPRRGGGSVYPRRSPTATSCSPKQVGARHLRSPCATHRVPHRDVRSRRCGRRRGRLRPAGGHERADAGAADAERIARAVAGVGAPLAFPHPLTQGRTQPMRRVRRAPRLTLPPRCRAMDFPWFTEPYLTESPEWRSKLHAPERLPSSCSPWRRC